jgi:hypothetical protein
MPWSHSYRLRLTVAAWKSVFDKQGSEAQLCGAEEQNFGTVLLARIFFFFIEPVSWWVRSFGCSIRFVIWSGKGFEQG